MDKEQKAVEIKSRIACAMIEAFGMNAENEQRKACGESMAFVYEDFTDLITQYGIGQNDIVSELCT